MSNGNLPFLLLSYKQLRLILSLLGIALPIILVVWGFFLCECIDIQDSINDYYSLRTRDALVGILLAVGVFLFTYKGMNEKGFLPSDKITGQAACLFAIGVAYFPNTGDDWEQTVHFISAGGLFIMLAIFCMFLFTKGRPGVPHLPKKK